MLFAVYGFFISAILILHFSEIDRRLVRHLLLTILVMAVILGVFQHFKMADVIKKRDSDIFLVSLSPNSKYIFKPLSFPNYRLPVYEKYSVFLDTKGAVVDLEAILNETKPKIIQIEVDIALSAPYSIRKMANSLSETHSIMYIDLRNSECLKEFGVASFREMEFYDFSLIKEFILENEGHKIIIFDNFEYSFEQFSSEDRLLEFILKAYDQNKELSVLIVGFDPKTKSKVISSNPFPSLSQGRARRVGSWRQIKASTSKHSSTFCRIDQVGT